MMTSKQILMQEQTLFLNEAKKKKVVHNPLTPKERQEAKERFGDAKGELHCGIFKDADGKYFCTTHRAASKHYDSIQAIPKKDYEFICSTS